MKLHPQLRVKLGQFFTNALNEALDGVEQQAPGLRHAELAFDAENEFVQVRVQLTTLLLWEPEEDE